MSLTTQRLSSLFVLALFLGSTAAAAADKLANKVRDAREAVERIMDAPDQEVPEGLLEKTRCLSVIPGVIKGAIGIGGRHGKGILTCRDDDGEWSAPIFVRLSGGSIGFQIGAEATDFLLFFMTEKSVRSLLKSKFTLGADASVAAGPVGRSASAGTDLMLNAEIYSYARSRGLFAGVSLEGARLAPHQGSINNYYDEKLWPEEVLFEHEVTSMPREARDFLAILP